MEATQAITLVSEWVQSHGVDYPSDELEAVRVEAGWKVYMPVDNTHSDPIAFTSTPMSRPVFLVSDSGRIEETSTSIPLQQTHERSTEQQATDHRTDATVDDNEFITELRRQFDEISAKGPPSISEFTIVDTLPQNDTGGGHTLNVSEIGRAHV